LAILHNGHWIDNWPVPVAKPAIFFTAKKLVHAAARRRGEKRCGQKHGTLVTTKRDAAAGAVCSLYSHIHIKRLYMDMYIYIMVIIYSNKYIYIHMAKPQEFCTKG